MPSGGNWGKFMLVNILFLSYIVAIAAIAKAQEVKDNWQENRCNPTYMPLADDVNENFNYCVQNSMTGYMGHILAPITYITHTLGNSVGSISEDVNSARAMFSKVRTFIKKIVQDIFAVFLNLVIEIQRIIIAMRDIVGKTIGTLTTLIYVLDGSVKTIQSMWNGPAGQTINAMCFDPDTKLKLADGSTVCMKDINLGDVLENGSVVTKTIKIDNKQTKTPLYCIENEGIEGNEGVAVYVTGSHFVYDSAKEVFVRVCEYPKAKLAKKDVDWFSCLSTNDNRIVIGNEIFWDWDDDTLRMPYICRLFM